MCAVVLAHVDELRCLAHCPEGSLSHVGRLAHKGHHRAVGGLARVNVEELHSLHALHLIRYLADDAHVAAFAEVGHALYYLLDFCHSNKGF